MKYKAIQNNKIDINLIPEVVNGRDWVLDPISNSATHTDCNDGTIDLKVFSIIDGTTYLYSLQVLENEGGYVQVSIGDALSEQITTTGFFEGSLTALSDNGLKIFSSGNSKVSLLTIKIESHSDEDEDINTRTIVFSEESNKWISFRSYVPDSGVSMFTDLYTFKDGKSYSHTDREDRNNFYGIQYDTKVKFQVSSAGVKTYNSIAVHSNKLIGTSEDGIETELGHVSDLIKEDFSTREGIHYANFLRDKLTDINDGSRLKGRYIVVEFEDKCAKKLHIFKIVVKSQLSTPNE